MAKFLSFMALSTLIIMPTFASALWDLETRDVSEPHLFGRELSEAEAALYAREVRGLYARQRDPKYVGLSRRHPNKLLKRSFNLLGRSESDSRADGNIPVQQSNSAHRRHAPFKKHELFDIVDRDFDDELLERNLDYELFGRFYDDLD